MQHFLWRIYGYAFLTQFILIYPVTALLFQERGLGAVQIGTLFAIWSATTIILEVPTGILADKFSRRSILTASSSLVAISYIIWMVSSSFPGFAFGFFLLGFAETLRSGTFEAFIYDELKQAKREHTFEQVSGHTHGFRSAGLTMGVLLGGFATEFGFMFALVPSVIVPLFAALLMLSIRPAPIQKLTGESQYWHILRDAFHEARHNPPLLRIMLIVSITFGVVGASDEIWSLWLHEIGFSFVLIGSLFAVANIFATFAGFTAHRINLPGRLLPAFALLAALLIILIAVINTGLAALLAIPYSYLIDVARVKYFARLQHSIQSHQRATVSSMNALLLEIVALVFYLSSGALADFFGYVSFLWLLGGVIGIASIVSIVWPAKTQKPIVLLEVQES